MKQVNRREVLSGMTALAAAGALASRAGSAAESRGPQAKWDIIVVDADVFNT